MLPRFADIFQQGNRWLNWLEKQPEGAVRPVVIESVTKIMACGTTLMGYTQWCCSSPDCCHTKKVCFRCKSRSCLHCGVKAGAQWIQYLLSLVPDCPWQHIVSSKREWNRFLDTHYRRGWNVNVSRVMDNATHVAVYFGSYLKKPPVPMSRLEHYAGQDEIGLRYNSHRTKREEYLLMSGDEFMERFSWHVADKGFRMVRYYGFLSPAKRRLLEEVVYIITETVRKTAMQITWRGMYQRLLKVDPLKCVLCGSQMRFTGLKRGYRLAEQVLMHEPLARMRWCG
ncbi:transposase [Shigella flexneri]|uniref:transposase n=1 Tax=Shigella flexneri TaxID=623 RepID=UPI001070BA51|nr:transposase [Shigella flexneri]